MSRPLQLLFVLVLSFTPMCLFFILALGFMETKKRTIMVTVFLWLYLLIPLPILMTAKDLTALEAAYWGFQALSTVGYGDIQMDTNWLKIFATAYTSVGMLACFWMKFLFIERAFRHMTRGKSVKARGRDLARATTIMLVITGVFAAYWGPRFKYLKQPGNVVVNGIYFTVTTFSTIGFGDLVPVGPTDCIIFGVLVVVGVPAWFYFVGCAAGFFTSKASRHFRFADQNLFGISAKLGFNHRHNPTGSQSWCDDATTPYTTDGSNAGFRELRESLAKERMSVLYRAATIGGAADADLCEALDGDDPKNSLIDIILTQDIGDASKQPRHLLQKAMLTEVTMRGVYTAQMASSNDELSTQGMETASLDVCARSLPGTDFGSLTATDIGDVPSEPSRLGCQEPEPSSLGRQDHECHLPQVRTVSKKAVISIDEGLSHGVLHHEYSRRLWDVVSI